MTKFLFCFGLSLALSLAAFGQAVFTGIWVRESKTHVLGPDFENTLPLEIQFTNLGDSLIVETVILTGNGNETRRHAYPANGKPVAEVSNGRKIVRSLAWSKRKTKLTLKMVVYEEGNEQEVDFIRMEDYHVADGKLHVNRKSEETRSESWAVKGVFVR